MSPAGMESSAPLLGINSGESSPRSFDEKLSRQSTFDESRSSEMNEARIWKIFSIANYYLKFTLFALLPTPIQRRMRPGAFPQTAKLYPTSYLDGLRGLASLFVVVMHFTGRHESDYTEAFGFGRNQQMPRSVMQLPFVRVIFAGRAWVHVFFVISGFALSLKPLRLARAHKYEEVFTTQSSLIFRRAIRLFLPAFVAMFLAFVILRPEGTIKNAGQGNLIDHLGEWYKALCDITYFWDLDHVEWWWKPYTTWTLPVEFSMSIFVIVVVAGLARCTVRFRLGMFLAIMFYCLRVGHWAAVEFVGGAFLAETGLIQDQAGQRHDRMDLPHHHQADENPSSENKQMSPRIARWRSHLWTLFYWEQLLIALFLLGWPDHHADDIPLMRALYPLTPRPYSDWGRESIPKPWWVLASLQTVFACQQSPLLQHFLNRPVVQYLGRISFSLYLLHLPILEGCGGGIMAALWRLVGGWKGDSFWLHFFVWAVGFGVFMVPAVWVSDVFSRAVDRPCTDLARWFDRWGVEKVE